MKTLKRRTLIRESDFYRIKSRALELYDRVYFKPVNCTEIEHEYIVSVLKGENHVQPDLEFPAKYLRTIKNKLYDVKYSEWLSYKDNNLIYVQSRKNAKPSCLGWVTFEKDFV